jgi:hypothetical protein
MLEFRRFEWIYGHFMHLDDSLLGSAVVIAACLRRGISAGMCGIEAY